MKFRLTTILLILAGSLMFAISLNFGSRIWYHFDTKNGSEVPSLIAVCIGSALSIALILYKIVSKTDIRRILLILGVATTIIIFDQYQKRLKQHRIATEGKETYAVVTFSGLIKAGKSNGHEIRYSYIVNNTNFEKKASNEEYILENAIQEKDSLIIRYWTNDPNCHVYSVIK